MKIYAGLWMGNVMQLERWGPLELDPGVVYLRIDRDLLEQAMKTHPRHDIEIRICPGHVLEAAVREELEAIDRMIERNPAHREELLRDRRAIAERLGPRRRTTAIPDSER